MQVHQMSTPDASTVIHIMIAEYIKAPRVYRPFYRDSKNAHRPFLPKSGNNLP